MSAMPPATDMPTMDPVERPLLSSAALDVSDGAAELDDVLSAPDCAGGVVVIVTTSPSSPVVVMWLVTGTREEVVVAAVVDVLSPSVLDVVPVVCVADVVSCVVEVSVWVVGVAWVVVASVEVVSAVVVSSFVVEVSVSFCVVVSSVFAVVVSVAAVVVSSSSWPPNRPCRRCRSCVEWEDAAWTTAKSTIHERRRERDAFMAAERSDSEGGGVVEPGDDSYRSRCARRRQRRGERRAMPLFAMSSLRWPSSGTMEKKVTGVTLV